MFPLIPLLVFLLPAAWVSWLLGKWLREGLAAILYYRLADLTPWLIDNHGKVVMTALTLSVAANLVLLAEMGAKRVHVGFIALLSITGGTLWMAAALVKPDWWLAPSNGLIMFTLVNTPLVTAMFSHLIMVRVRDDILHVLVRVLLALGAIALLHVATTTFIR